MFGIPSLIIDNAPESDFIGSHSFEPICNYCKQSDGDHHIAYPIATEQRRQDRINASSLRYDYITFDTARMA